MQNQLKKALNLVKKTGDKIIIFDNPQSENAFVVMGLNDYEKLVLGKSEIRGLTEDKLLDKINRDIAIWKSDQETGEILGQDKKNIEFEKIKFDGNIIKKKAWSIPEKVKESAEEIIEEDKQYLENAAF